MFRNLTSNTTALLSLMRVYQIELLQNTYNF